jgi:glycosyltransferase involved in cell wall biosynthesis
LHALNLEIEPLKYYNSVVAISNAVKTDIEERSNFSPCLIYNGINFDSIKFKNKGLLNNSNFIRLVQVGRLNSKIKGQDILIKALNHLVTAKDFGEFEMDFIGSGDSYNDLMEMVVKFHLEQKITFLGNKSRDWIYDNLHDYDVFIQPSRFEGFGLTVVEAMAAKIPVIVADNDGPSEIIKKGEYGYIFENGDYEGLSNKMLDVIKNIKLGRQRAKSERAYVYANDKFNIQTTAKEYIKEYQRVLDKNNQKFILKNVS